MNLNFSKNNNKKIAVIGIVGIPASYGGFETLVERLIEEESIDFDVYCSSKNYGNRLKNYKGAKLIYIPLRANGISSILYDISSIVHALFRGHKNFLILGVSGAVIIPILRLFSGIRIITNIDGIEWKRDKWNTLARFFLRFSEYLAVRFSHEVISDNAAITEYALRHYKRNCVTIAYGGDHAINANHTKNKFHKAIIVSESLYGLSICRIEPENNIHLILEAFSKVETPIIFIGNWENSDYGKNLYKKYSNYKNINLLKPVYCIDTLYSYRSSCSFYIHGHSAGGTNPSLVEMMHFSKPIVAYDCSFNRATMENKGNYFSTLKDLTKILGETNTLHDGNDLTEIAKRRYSWEIIRKEYLELLTT